VKFTIDINLTTDPALLAVFQRLADALHVSSPPSALATLRVAEAPLPALSFPAEPIAPPVELAKPVEPPFEPDPPKPPKAGRPASSRTAAIPPESAPATPAPPAKPVETIAIEEVRAAIADYARINREGAIALLKEHGAASVSKLEPAKYAQVMQDLNVRRQQEAP